jgi:hypothetical protein
MEKMNFIYYLLGVFTLFVGIIAHRPMKRLWHALKTRINRVFTGNDGGNDILDIILISELTRRVDELEGQLDNLAERLATRESNRKNNVRREVRDYLEDLKK